MSSVAALRALLDQKFPDATPIVRRTVQPVASGINALDRALPNGGFPLGRLSVCEPRGGTTAILRASCQHTVANGDRAAWIDGARTIAGAYWDDGPLLVRPESHTHAIRAADELLRSGGFRLVVLTGVSPTDTDTMKLVRAVHDGGGAFAIIAKDANMAALRIAARIEEFCWSFDPFGEPAELKEVRIRIHARALGWDKRATFTIPVKSHELRASLEPGLADRRGLPKTKRTGKTAVK